MFSLRKRLTRHKLPLVTVALAGLLAAAGCSSKASADPTPAGSTHEDRWHAQRLVLP